MNEGEIITEKCECCEGTGLCTTDYIDDFSACMNCCGSGTLTYPYNSNIINDRGLR